MAKLFHHNGVRLLFAISFIVICQVTCQENVLTSPSVTDRQEESIPISKEVEASEPTNAQNGEVSNSISKYDQIPYEDPLNRTINNVPSASGGNPSPLVEIVPLPGDSALNSTLKREPSPNDLVANMNKTGPPDDLPEAEGEEDSKGDTAVSEVTTISPSTERIGDVTNQDGSDIPTTPTFVSTVDKDVSTNAGTLVRKCCPEVQYFSLTTFTCTPLEDSSLFKENVLQILINNSDIVSLETGFVECPTPPAANYFGVTSMSHGISTDGRVTDRVTTIAYNQSQYCLEMLGKSSTEMSFTFAYCQNVEATAEDPRLSELRTQNETNGEQTIAVRKCCPENAYFNPVSNKCTVTDTGDSELFSRHVMDLSHESNVISVEISSLPITSCPGPTTNFPSIHTIHNQTHQLLSDDTVIEVETDYAYNQSYYCMELIGPTYDSLSLQINLCPRTDFVLPKCCPVSYYFDELELNCLPNLHFDYPKENLLDNYYLDNNTYTIKPLSVLLSCQHIQNAVPTKVIADSFHVKSGTLCRDEGCYEVTDYCIDYVGDSTVKQIKAAAYYCRSSFFAKCCRYGQVLDGNECVNYYRSNSLLLKFVMSNMTGILTFDYNQCKDKKYLLLDDNTRNYVHWRLGEDGSYIVVETANFSRKVSDYCIEDLKYSNGKVQPIAYVCESDLEDMITIGAPDPAYFQRPDSLGKCCPLSHGGNTVSHFSSLTGSCSTATLGSSMELLENIGEFRFTKEHYYGFPKCNGKLGYHDYPVNSSVGEEGGYTTLTEQGYLQIVNRNGKCVQNQELVTDRDYCLEYTITGEGNREPIAFICTNATVEQLYSERSALVTAFLSISCVCLFLTLVSLFSMRVRRGIVSVRKVNTLAGRILVSFVTSHMIGFVSLSIAQFENAINKIDSPSCYVLAGFIQFFNLATFCWNTSICLESLLLTINIRIPNWARYLLHSLWAWGFPTIMTLLMFLMDANRESLSCGAIVPNIGTQFCFIYGSAAKFLYFYLPILITLTANVSFLIGAKTLRNVRLKRLAKGNPGGVTGKSSQEGKPPVKQSGMRLHHNQNLKAESFRLILWTGGTWFLELAGFVMSRYILLPQQASWFYYLWYIPTSLNALRGVGIFGIIVITPEIQQRGRRVLKRLKRSLTTKMHTVLPKYIPPVTEDDEDDYKTKRNMTMTTRVSSFRSNSPERSQ